MSFLWVLILILSPVEIPVSAHAGPEDWQALKALSLTAELVGPHENWVPDFRSEVRYVRHHARALMDAPPLADAALLPPLEYTADAARIAEQHLARLEWHQFSTPHRSDWFAAAITEVRGRACVWESIRAASMTGHAWAHRRTALARVREVMGPEAYYAGRWPAPVPLWTLTELP